MYEWTEAQRSWVSCLESQWQVVALGRSWAAGARVCTSRCAALPFVCVKHAHAHTRTSLFLRVMPVVKPHKKILPLTSFVQVLLSLSTLSSLQLNCAICLPCSRQQVTGVLIGLGTRFIFPSRECLLYLWYRVMKKKISYILEYSSSIQNRFKSTYLFYFSLMSCRSSLYKFELK